MLSAVNWDADQHKEILIPRMTLKAGRSIDKKSRCDMTCKRRDHDGYRKTAEEESRPHLMAQGYNELHTIAPTDTRLELIRDQ